MDVVGVKFGEAGTSKGESRAEMVVVGGKERYCGIVWGFDDMLAEFKRTCPLLLIWQTSKSNLSIALEVATQTKQASTLDSSPDDPVANADLTPTLRLASDEEDKGEQVLIGVSWSRAWRW